MAHRFPAQGFQSNQRMPNRGSVGMYNQPVNPQRNITMSSARPPVLRNQGMSQGNFPMSSSRPPSGSSHGIAQRNFPMSSTRPPSGSSQGVSQGNFPVSSTRPPSGSSQGVSQGNFQRSSTRPPIGCSQGMPQGNFPMSSTRPLSGTTQGLPQGNLSATGPVGNMMQGSGQYQVQQDRQFDSNPQGQMGSQGMQHGPIPTNSMAQGPIVQHVMIPVPVPVGTTLPPHFLRPHVITSSVPNQGIFTGAQNHGQFPEMQGQDQVPGMQGQFPVIQNQFQGDGQTSNIPGQSNLQLFQSEGQFQNPRSGLLTHNTPARGSGTDDLSYYIGNESRNAKRDRSGENTYKMINQDYTRKQRCLSPEDIYAHRTATAEEYRHHDQERKFQVQQRIPHGDEDEKKRIDRSRSQSSSKHSFASEHVERSDTSSFNREQVDRYWRNEDEEMHSHKMKNTGQFERQEVFDNNKRYEREHHFGQQGGYGRQGEYEKVNRIENTEINQRSSRQTEFEQNRNYKGQGDFQRYVGHENFQDVQQYIRNDVSYKGGFEDVRNVQHSNPVDYGGKQRNDFERHSKTVLYTDGKREDLESSNIHDYRDKQRTESERHSKVILFTGGKRHDFEGDESKEFRNKKSNEFERGSSAVLYTDGEREDLESRGIEQYEREKRKLSPVSSERSSRKLKRDYSPVSESKSHGELKIHVSDRGRWIETDQDYSPISGRADDIERFNDERDRRERNVNMPDKTDLEQNSLDGAEIISDSESYIADTSIVHAQNLSPVSQQSSRHESQRFHNRTEAGRFQGEERISPSRSNHSKHSEGRISPSDISKYSEGRGSHSHQSWLSEDRQKERRHSPGGFESSGLNHKNQQFDMISTDFQLYVPDLCPAHNQKGCHWDGCKKLHVCKFFIKDVCNFGEYCTKGHNILKGQSYDTLCKMNPGFRHSNTTAEQIKLTLQKRIAKGYEQKLTTQQSRIEHKPYFKKLNEKEMSPIRESINVVAADPSFDARNYTPGGNFENVLNVEVGIKKNQSHTKKSKQSSVKNTDKEQKNTDQKKGSETKKSYSLQTNKESCDERKSEKNENLNNNYSKKDSDTKTKKNVNSSVKTIKRQKTVQPKDETMLSPVSGDEDDWEKYEKYEQISDDGMSEKDKEEDGLDNVSSDESSIEQVQVNRSIDTFPLPTPENIAVPIGMNDPLVFNRPLKNNPQSYIGPLNRPPPMFPIATEGNAPLFPVVSQNQTLMPGMPSIHTAVPNHLPSPEFMKQVIQNLPTFKTEPTEHKNLFKNDNNPAVTEMDSQRKKIKMDKVEREPELKETIKKLWKFPHKGIVNMSIIEFVTETEAYKEEFIAEIVKILVTLELPYVTIKKLLSVIKDKVSINIKSETDMRKILEMYPNNFRIIEMVDSDDESDDLDTKKNVQIKANIGIGFCEKHGFLPFAIGKCECNALHLCKFYFLSDCPNKHCKFGHKLRTDHNIAVLKQHKLHRLTGEEILNFIADVDNRNKETIPNICKYYIREKGCYKGDNTDYETICHSLHLCSYILKGKCMNRECDRSHSIYDKQPLSLLQKYGLDPYELGDEKVLQILSDKCIENDKGKKIAPLRQSQPMKGSAKSGTLSRRLESKTSNTTAGGLQIVTKSETRISSKYFVQNFKVPAVCKFYQNALGCRKKDWGADGKCFFLHICQHYVTGDCNYGDKCKRSHDLFSGQAAEILEKYNFDLDNLTASDILKRLNSNSGDPVELPKPASSSGIDNENIEITLDCVGEPDEIDASNFEIPKHSMELETRINVEEKDAFSSVTEGIKNKSNISDDTCRTKPAKKISGSCDKKISRSYDSCNIEDVIKHIMEHNKVDKK